MLIGFRCAGKSTVGRLLSKRLKKEFVDCDEYIEKKMCLLIREIFDLWGESYFRLLEGQAIADLCKLDGRVIATGGGAALRYKNIHNLKRNGYVIYLEVAPAKACERITRDPQSRDRRPPLSTKELFEEVTEQLAFRRRYYLNAADLTVATDERSGEEVVAEILAHLKARGLMGPEEGDDSEASLA